MVYGQLDRFFACYLTETHSNGLVCFDGEGLEPVGATAPEAAVGCRKLLRTAIPVRIHRLHGAGDRSPIFCGTALKVWENQLTYESHEY